MPYLRHPARKGVERLAVAEHYADVFNPFRPRNPLDRLEQLMSALDNAIYANTAAVTQNTAAVNDLIAKVTSPDSEPTPAQFEALAANTAQISANNTAVATALNPAPTALTLSPPSVSATVGVASSATIAITGGTAPYSLVAPQPGITLTDASGATEVVFDTTTTAFSGTVEVSDSSSPAVTADLGVTIS